MLGCHSRWEREMRPALGPKGLIVIESLTPVCAIPLFSYARLLLVHVVTVHDTLTLLWSAML